MKFLISFWNRLFFTGFIYVSLQFPLYSMLQIQEVTSDQGIKAWLIEDHTLPLLSINLSFQAGSAYEPEGKAGLTSLLNNLLLRGAGPYSTLHLREKLNRLGIQLYSSVSADFFDFLLRTQRSHLKESFDLLKVILREAHFDQKELEKEKSSQLLALKEEQKNPDLLLARTYIDLIVSHHPYGKQPSETSIKKIQSSDLKKFVKQAFTRDTLKISVCGDITPQELKILLDQTCTHLPKKSTLPPLFPVAESLKGTTKILSAPLTQSQTLFSQKALPFSHPDYIKQVILNEIIGGAFAGLYAEIRTKRGNAYYVSTAIDHSYKLFPRLSGSVGSENNRTFENISLIKKVWQDIKEKGISQEELDLTKSYIKGVFAMNLNSSLKIASLLTHYQKYGYPIDFPQKRATLIQNINLQEMNEFAKSFLDPDNLIFVVIGDLKH